jgi:hypothetical protein
MLTMGAKNKGMTIKHKKYNGKVNKWIPAR